MLSISEMGHFLNRTLLADHVVGHKLTRRLDQLVKKRLGCIYRNNLKNAAGNIEDGCCQSAKWVTFSTEHFRLIMLL
jgi:hypothetical protein